MLWDEYYDGVTRWAASTAVSRMSQLESFGPPEEIVDAIDIIGYDDRKGATRLLKKALRAGVRFTGEQLSDLSSVCEEEVIRQAIQTAAPHFTAADLEALCGYEDDDVLIALAKKHHLPLPESLADWEYDAEPDMTPAELAAEYDYILDCLQNAHALLKKAYQFSLIDTSRKKRSATVAKYACIADAQTYISAALDAWSLLDIPSQDKQPLHGIWPNISNATMWQNYLFQGFFTNMLVKRQIRNVIKNIETAHRMIRRLRSAL